MKKAKKKAKGRPRELNGRWAVSLALYLQGARPGLSARVAVATAWEALHDLYPAQFPESVPPDSLWNDLLRHVKNGRRGRIVFPHLPELMLAALKRLPSK